MDARAEIEMTPAIRRTLPTAAVILNYRTPDATVAAVRSLERSDTAVAAIIVVDNASGDDSPEVFRRELSDVRLVASPTNVGFSGGCNLGIQEARRLGVTAVFLVNSDVIVSPGALGALQAAIDADPELGVAGPIVVDLDAPDRVQSLGIRWSPATGRMRHLGFGRSLASIAPFSRRDVDGLSGCALLIRTAVLDRIGLLDDAFFFGFEDLEFCLRARAAGFRCACIGPAVVRHAGSLSAGRGSARRLYFAARNHLLLARRTSASRPALSRAIQTASIVALNLTHALGQSEVPRGQAVRSVWQGIRDHRVGRYGPATDSR